MVDELVRTLRSQFFCDDVLGRGWLDFLSMTRSFADWASL